MSDAGSADSLHPCKQAASQVAFEDRGLYSCVMLQMTCFLIRSSPSTYYQKFVVCSMRHQQAFCSKLKRSDCINLHMQHQQQRARVGQSNISPSSLGEHVACAAAHDCNICIGYQDIMLVSNYPYAEVPLQSGCNGGFSTDCIVLKTSPCMLR